jgi:hypothetical protein
MGKNLTVSTKDVKVVFNTSSKEFTEIMLFYASLFVPQKNRATVPGPV